MPLAPRLTALLAAAAALAPAAALAEPVLGGSQIEIEIKLPAGEGEFLPPADDLELERHFNLARCYCGDAAPSEVTDFTAELRLDPQISDSDTNVDVWLGVDCLTDDLPTRTANCGDMPAFVFDRADDLNTERTLQFSVSDLMLRAADADCPEIDRTANIYAAPDAAMTGIYDETEQFFYPDGIPLDTTPPPVPSEFAAATGGESAIFIDWEPIATPDEVYRWQALCARIDETGVYPAFDDPDIDPLWETAESLCDASTTEEYVTEIPAPGTGTAVELPEPLAELDPAFICGDAAGTASEIRVEGLENDEEYVVVLLAIDRAGNVAGVTPGRVLVPKPVIDFWEDLHANGSDVEGGFCLLAETYGGGGPITNALRGFRDGTLADTALGRWLTRVYYDHTGPLAELARESVLARIAFAIVLAPVVVLALLWHVFTLPGLVAIIALAVLWRRRRRAILAAAIALAPATASAQSFAPYWEDVTEDEIEGPDQIKWHAGLKAGPYVPEIDDQAGVVDADGKGPYERLYGGYEILPVLEVDRFLWTPPGGQLGIGGSIGVMGKTANSFRFEDADGDGEYDVGETLIRSKGDRTKFRLVPVAASVIYRLTLLDDEWGIPLVPYLRGGLAYYIWWNTRPSGAISTVPPDNKARGASLGLQGSLGLAVRAERIDPTAAASMRDGGIYHAGFYVEYQLGWVDGFGSEKKLAVGDDTWFAGVNFEF